MKTRDMGTRIMGRDGMKGWCVGRIAFEAFGFLGCFVPVGLATWVLSLGCLFLAFSEVH